MDAAQSQDELGTNLWISPIWANRELTDSSPMHMFYGMNMNANHNSNAGQPDTIGGVLASALNLEDDISTGVYRDYVNRQHWPEGLQNEVFLEIRKRLHVLIEDTKKHKKILQALVREHD